MHHVLESTEPSDDVVIEERLFTKINGWVLSGAVDHQVIKGQTVEITSQLLVYGLSFMER